MKSKRTEPVAALVVGMAAWALMMGGCGGAVPASRFYVIDYYVDPLAVGTRLDVVLGIERFSTRALYRDRRIAHRSSEHEVIFYPYSYWAAPPGDLVAEQLAEHFRQARIVRTVTIAPFAEPPDWLLSGHVEQFEEVAKGEQAVARLELRVRIESTSNRAILREEGITIEKPLSGRGPEQVAAAMSTAVREAGERLVEILREMAPKP